MLSQSQSKSVDFLQSMTTLFELKESLQSRDGNEILESYGLIKPPIVCSFCGKPMKEGGRGMVQCISRRCRHVGEKLITECFQENKFLVYKRET